MGRVVGVCVALLAWCHHPVLAGPIRAWAGEEYDVGFRVLRKYDHSRAYRIAGSGPYGSRPMQVGVWYPAEESPGEPLRYLDYAALESACESLQEPDRAAYGVAGRRLRAILADDAHHRAVSEFEFRSRRDAPAVEGRFPLVLYGAAQRAGGFENAAICEQLASRGYVVATFPSRSYFHRPMPLNVEGSLAQVRDFEFVLGLLLCDDSVDPGRIGAFGFSFGALNALLFAAQSKRVEAVACLDGSIPIGYQNGIVAAHELADVPRMSARQLFFNGSKISREEFPLPGEAAAADTYLFWTRDLPHTSFSSTNLLLFPRPRREHAALQEMEDRLIAFFEMVFRGDPAFHQEFEEYSPELFLGGEFHPGQAGPEVPKDEFIELVNREGVDRGVEVYRATRESFPDYVLFDYEPFRDVGYLLMQKGDFDAAARVFEVLVDAYPDRADSHRRVGEAYLELGRFPAARVAFARGLELDPESPALHDLMRRLEEREGRR